jgi:hypothetical protein
MNKLLTFSLSVGLAMASLPACGTDPATDKEETGSTTDSGNDSTGNDTGTDVSSDGFTISGNYSGTDIPAGSKIAILWMVTSGSPDYAYKLGEGTMGDGSFSITLPEPLPSECVNSWGAAVGLVVAMRSDLTIPDGEIEGDEPEGLLGVSARQAIIWREAALDGNGPSWANDFSVGYSCGQCVPTGETFDAYEPANCDDSIVIDGLDGLDGEEPEFCNWT